MSLWAKVGWAALGLLVALGLALMFWLDLILGTVFALFCGGVFWYVFGVLKKKTDSLIKTACRNLGLEYRPHPFRYADLSGRFQGLPVKISYESGRTLGLGSVLVASGEVPGWAALDVRNVTLIRAFHGLEPPPKGLISAGPPLLKAHKEELRLYYPGIVTDHEMLRQGLGVLSREIGNRRKETC